MRYYPIFWRALSADTLRLTASNIVEVSVPTISDRPIAADTPSDSLDCVKLTISRPSTVREMRVRAVQGICESLPTRYDAAGAGCVPTRLPRLI